jgi:hypothetical protein
MVFAQDAASTAVQLRSISSAWSADLKSNPSTSAHGALQQHKDWFLKARPSLLQAAKLPLAGPALKADQQCLDTFGASCSPADLLTIASYLEGKK